MKYVRPLTLYRELLKKNRALLKATEEPHSINLNLLKKYVNLEYPENLMALADRSLELSKKPPQMYRLVAFNIIRDGITFSVPGYPDNKEAFFLKFHPYAVRGIEAPYLKATLERLVGELMSNFSDVPPYAHERIIDMYSAVGILQGSWTGQSIEKFRTWSVPSPVSTLELQPDPAQPTHVTILAGTSLADLRAKGWASSFKRRN
ncbi:hypothetical protein Q3G72_020257 [Acer saccharum]|nr:hypothetical protein Q3G72_020257 [Acer saccharum]